MTRFFRLVFLFVVYKNADLLFSLNNFGPETVRLYDGAIGPDVLIDSETYQNTVEYKSWSRLPEGTGVCPDRYAPTPGGPNV